MPVLERDGRRLLVSHAFGTERACASPDCGAVFLVTSITGRHLYCSERCKEREQWRKEYKRPEVVVAARARCRAWDAEHRAVKGRNPWLYGAPPFGEYLPGGAFSLRVTPPPRWPIELRNTRALHGLVTELINERHHPTIPGFTLIPTALSPSGWGVHVANAKAALRLAGRQLEGVLFDRKVTVTCGPMHRIKSPTVSRRGRRRLRIDAITPVCIRSMNSTVTHVVVTGANLCSTLAAWLPQRLGLEIGDDDLRLMLVDRRTTIEHTRTGGKYGVTRGFVGHLIVETNAVGEWLLRCAETLGLGGRTAFGFGRIRLSTVEPVP